MESVTVKTSLRSQTQPTSLIYSTLARFRELAETIHPILCSLMLRSRALVFTSSRHVDRVHNPDQDVVTNGGLDS